MLDTLARTYRVAFAGNPNCGKTALFNALTGSRQKVANYPGVTVERKEGQFTTPGGRQVTAIDLPGTYSLRGRSRDEIVTREAILGKAGDVARPDCVADATNLRLILRLVLELASAGIPMILALNMADIAEPRGIRIDAEGLSRTLGIPVLATVYAVGGAALDDVSLSATIASEWSLATALSLLAWYEFAPQCAPTLAVVHRETNSWRWPVLMFGYMMALAYGASFVVYRTALALGG